jgi:peroxiredoxin
VNALMCPSFFKTKVPELHATRWYNSPPLKWKELQGKVVLVDFMTYSCVNCVRTFPHMRYLWSQLKEQGLVIIGVQSPEFQFEKDFRNIEDAIKRHGLEYPIAVDNDYAIWNAFGNQYWPQQWFIDRDGVIRHMRAGEGGEQEIEEWVLRLLKEAGRESKLESGSHQELVRSSEPITSETYCGFLRNTGMGNPAACDANGRCVYRDKDSEHQLGVIYLEGQWKQSEEFLEHGGALTGHILLRFKATEVNLVMTADAPVEVEVKLDGAPVPNESAGADIRNNSGRTIMVVDRQDMYQMVRSKVPELHELTISVQAPGLRCYAYTFG